MTFSSVAQSCPTLRPHESQHARPPCPSPTPGVHPNSCPLSRWCHPAISSSVVSFSSCLQSLLASVFSNESTLRMRWPKYWSFSFSISPSNEHPGLISFRMGWLDLLAVQGTLKSLLQFSSVQFSRSVVSNSLQPHESQHARPPCPSPTPGVHPDSRPSSQWCHPAISPSVVRPLLLLPPIPPSISLFQWVNSSNEVAKVLEFQL